MKDHVLDEIDIFELVGDIKDQWRWLLAGIVGVFALAVLYVSIAQPVYQVESVLKEVSEVELMQLNQPRLRSVLLGRDTQGVTKEDVYISSVSAFKSARTVLRSHKTLQLFYDRLVEMNKTSVILNNELSQEQNFLKFITLFKFIDPGVKETDRYLKITFESPDAEVAVQILNDYVSFALDLQRQEAKASVADLIGEQLAQWRFDVEQLRLQYSAEKQRRLLVLKEASDIAFAINQQQPIYSADRVAVGVEPPLYMMGEKALRAEVRQLLARPEYGEDEYIKGVPELLWKITEVEKLQIQWDKVQFMDVDRLAITPTQPLKPRKLLILAIGIVVGGMIGVVAALIVAASRRRQERKRLEAEAATN